MVLIKILLLMVFGISKVLLQVDVPPPPLDLVPPPPPLDIPPIEADPSPANDELISNVVNETADPLAGNTTMDDLNAGDTIIDLNINETVIVSNDSSTSALNLTVDISMPTDDIVSNATSISDKVPSEVVNETVSTALDVNITVTDAESELSNKTVTDLNIVSDLNVTLDVSATVGNTSDTNATDVKSFLDITAEFDQLTRNISDNSTLQELQTDTNATDPVLLDPFLSAGPVDLPPPSISLHFGQGEEQSSLDSTANVSGNVDGALNDSMTDSFVDGNLTSVNSLDPFLLDIEPPNGTDVLTTPVDIPPAPFDMPSFNVNKTADTTTIEISELMVKQLSKGVNETTPELTSASAETSTVPMGTVTTTKPETENSSLETTTSVTTMARPEPVVAQFAPLGDTPDHPPPIIFGERPSVYTDQYGPVSGRFQQPQDPSTPTQNTASLPPPPIQVKTQPERRVTWLDRNEVYMTPPPTNLVDGKHVNGLNPRYMNVAELAEYALKVSGNRPATQKRPGYHVSYPTQPAYTTPAPTTTTLSPTVVGGYPRAYQASAFIDYLEKKYGITNPVSSPRRHALTTPKQIKKTRPFYDPNYLLSQNAEYNQPTTNTPMLSLRKFNDDHSFLSQTTQRPPSRPLTGSSPTKAQPRFFNAEYLLSHLGEWTAKPVVNNQQPTVQQHSVLQEQSQSKSQPTGNQKPTQAMLQRLVNQKPDTKSIPTGNQGPVQAMPQRPVYRELPQTKSLPKGNNNPGQAMPQRPVYQEPPQTNSQPTFNQEPAQTMPQRPMFQEETSPFKPKAQPTLIPNAHPFDSNLNNVKPTAFNQFAKERFNDFNVLKDQRFGQTDTRPLRLEPPVNPQSFVDYTANPERNVRMFIKLKHKAINTGSKQQPQAKLSPNVVIVPQTAKDFARFKPVIYGNEQIMTKQAPQHFDVKSRFNRKWYHPEDKRGIKHVRAAPVDLNIIKGDTVNSRPTTGVDFKSLFGAPLNPDSQHTSQSTSNGAGPRKHTFQQQTFNQHNTQQTLEQQQLLQQHQAFRQQIHRQKELIQEQQKQRENFRNKQEELARQQRLKEQAIVDRQQQHQESYFQIQQQKQEEAKRKLEQQRRDAITLLGNHKNINLPNVNQPNTLNQQNKLPIGSLRGQTEIRPYSNMMKQPMIHTYQPHVPVSSVNIFQAPAFPDRNKRSKKPIQNHQIPSKQETKLDLETRWKAEVGLPNIHGHLPVPHTVRVKPLQSVNPVDLTQNRDIKTTTPSPQTVVTTMMPTLPPTPTTTTQRTPPPTADPNPPAIFSLILKHTFMPMPKIDPTTKSPISDNGTNGAAAGWTGSQNTGQNDGRCQGCVFINDRCLLPDPVHCSMFIECVRQGSMVRAFSRRCALSSFFDRKSFLCVDPKNADCPTDRCRIPGTKWYPIEGHCKHYWQCAMREGGGVYAQSQCCPDMGGFVEGEGCVENPNCTESCESVIVQDAPTGCQLRKSASPTVYFDGNANIERPCAPGTVFNELACTCVQDVTVERNTPSPGDALCRPSLALTFDSGVIEDKSNTNQHLGNEGISVTLEGEAVSNGAGKLVLWRYANHMFPLVMAVRFRFLSTSTSPRMQTIFTNCNPKGGIEPSLEISIDTLYHEVLFKVNTLNGATKRFSIIYTQSQWSQVDVIYDGERIVGAVDRRARNIFAGGGIETRPNPISVGSCREKDGFRGLLDDVYLYEECIPDDMYGIFMSVLE
ncbi:hypothetical protein ACF0H5_016847 [Mactra antiquata]